MIFPVTVPSLALRAARFATCVSFRRLLASKQAGQCARQCNALWYLGAVPSACVAGKGYGGEPRVWVSLSFHHADAVTASAAMARGRSIWSRRRSRALRVACTTRRSGLRLPTRSNTLEIVLIRTCLHCTFHVSLGEGIITNRGNGKTQSHFFKKMCQKVCLS